MDKTCACCNGDCHGENIRNFAASTQWREKAIAYSSALMDFREMLIRWASQSMEIYKETEKSEYREIANNYLREVEKINSALGASNTQEPVE